VVIIVVACNVEVKNDVLVGVSALAVGKTASTGGRSPGGRGSSVGLPGGIFLVLVFFSLASGSSSNSTSAPTSLSLSSRTNSEAVSPRPRFVLTRRLLALGRNIVRRRSGAKPLVQILKLTQCDDVARSEKRTCRLSESEGKKEEARNEAQPSIAAPGRRRRSRRENDETGFTVSR
jgi:hypothetical protein